VHFAPHPVSAIQASTEVRKCPIARVPGYIHTRSTTNRYNKLVLN
jgi:hypothetical protein